MPPVRIRRLGQLFRRAHLLQRERTPAWAVALAAVLYPMGLSLRKISAYLALHGVERAHTAVWYWLQKLGDKSLWTGKMPSRIVVDETWVKVGGRSCWIFTALDPQTGRVLYLEPFWERDSWSAVAFLQALGEHYGALPQEVVVDGAEWWAIALSRFGMVRVVMARGIRNAIEGFYGEFLKRRVKDFDRYFPTWDRELKSVRRWLRVFAWWYNATRLDSLPQLI